MASELIYDSIDTISLKKYNQQSSVISTDSQSPTTVSSSTADLCDLDVNALDEEFKCLILETQTNMRELRADPNNSSKKQSVIRTKEKMNQIKLWSSKLNTEEGRRLLDEQRKDIEKRKYEIDQVLKIVKAQSAVDICFVMDCTSSMRRYMKAAKKDIYNLTKTITALFKTAPCLAFIGYRDIDYKENNLIQFNFTTDVDAFRQFLSEITTIKGADYCADVIGGLEAVRALEWSNPNRILIHVCDAPCHGRNYYDKQKERLVSRNKWDHYPDGDPCKRDLCKLLLDIKRQNIQYFSIQLTEYTAKMFKEFEVIYGPIFQLDVTKPSELIKVVSKITTSSIMATINDTMSIFQTTEQRKQYSLTNVEPDWSRMNVYPILITEFILPNTIEELFRSLFVGTEDGKMQIATNPFAQGSLRYAYYGKLGDDGYGTMDVVYKELISADPRYNTLTAYKQHLEIHTIAQFLAKLFNQAQRGIFRNPIDIVYADANIVQQKQDETKIYQVERRLNQTIQKWNNNSGGIHFADYSTILQAFSHWTHHQTAGRMMVVDLQGVKSSEDNSYLLTDPAIHFDDIKRCREARTNLGAKGMREFFRTHVCSEVCQKLGLEKIINDIDEDIIEEFYKSDEMTTITEGLEEDEVTEKQA